MSNNPGEAVALSLLEKNYHSPEAQQLEALEMACGYGTWTDRLISALKPYLDPKQNPAVRYRVLDILTKVGEEQLPPMFVGVILGILRTEPDPDARLNSLQILSQIHSREGDTLLQLLWSAVMDTSEPVRKEAALLCDQRRPYSNEELIGLARLIGADHAAGVRGRMISLLIPVMHIHEARTAVAHSFAGRPGVFDRVERDRLVEMLSPYAAQETIIDRLLREGINGWTGA